MDSIAELDRQIVEQIQDLHVSGVPVAVIVKHVKLRAVTVEHVIQYGELPQKQLNPYIGELRR